MPKNKYVYSNNLMMRNPYKQVEVKRKNIFQRLFCNHDFQYLVREKVGTIFCNPNGDEIEEICPKCGASKGTMFWEHEGMGYR
jgi:hypothetical protein